jgi:hypothetical protein
MTARHTQSASYDVGYGKPPRHTQFRKGQSGNPGGRRCRAPVERMKALMLEEAYRPVAVKEDGMMVPVTALQAILRGQIELAIIGAAAQRAVLKMVRAFEQGEADKAGLVGRHDDVFGLVGEELAKEEEMDDDDDGEEEKIDDEEETAEDDEIADGEETADAAPAKVDASSAAPPVLAPFDVEPQTSHPEALEPPVVDPPVLERVAAPPRTRRRGASQPVTPPLNASAEQLARWKAGRRRTEVSHRGRGPSVRLGACGTNSVFCRQRRPDLLHRAENPASDSDIKRLNGYLSAGTAVNQRKTPKIPC